ncbi:hypothetical protein QQS21_002822 [Conoideocrella luteorostrata]|uniref:Ferric-chelate reductase n=1 Tax=Conoideocrella luteorostrata TaxID=1105319 RepID=A0AAJ0CUG5_9HYPO|nr:hypothetical protein QQS21_002822 [Conoideocrella luteorostrata]
MRLLRSCLIGVATLPSGILSLEVTNARESKGFMGYGLTLYEPPCAFTCLFTIAAPLNCTDADLAGVAVTNDAEASSESSYPVGKGWRVTTDSTDACKSHNEHFMKTAAYCVKSRCAGLPEEQLSMFYSAQFPGNKSGLEPLYQNYEALVASITADPKDAINATRFLNYTAYVPDELYQPWFDLLRTLAENEKTSSWYAMVVFVSGAIIPISLSLLRFLPWPSSWCTKFNAWFIDPPLVGKKHAAPIWGLGMVPTRGQSIFIAYMWAINIASSCDGISYSWPSSIYSSKTGLIERYVANRSGVMSCALFPLVMLYAGRNNLLLWLTNWSHSTFLLMHRWTAVLCMLHAVIHGIGYLDIALRGFNGFTRAELSELYWKLGAAATCAMVFLCISSVQIVRRNMYELFLILHIALAIVALAGTYHHINIVYKSNWGFENWLIMATAVWAFDRAIRLARSLRHGVKRAFLTSVDDEYYRLDVPNMSATGHVYLHFPTISLWRVWESHPFSVASVTHRKSHMRRDTFEQDPVPEKTSQDIITTICTSVSDRSSSDQSAPEPTGTSGVVVFIRKQGGLTKLLSKKGAREKGIPVLVEGSYDIGTTFLQDQHPTPTHDFPNLICVAGGVGITGVLPALDHFNTAGMPCGSRKVYWGVRTIPLVHAVESMLGYDCGPELHRTWGSIDVSLSVGARINLREVLERDLRSQKGGTIVVVCGPSGMADDVRYIVSAMARHSGHNGPILVKLVVESFTW